jgi:hypothetical protein
MGNSQMIEEVAANAGFLTPATLPPYPVVPADISAFNNDAGYITAAEVPPGFSGDYNDLTNKPNIPDTTSDLVNDSGFITQSSTNVLTNKSGLISQWTNNSNYLTLGTLPAYPTVPTNVLAFTNDAGYITATSADTLRNKTWQGAAIADAYIASAATWNAKQNALGFTPVPNTRMVSGQQLTADIDLRPKSAFVAGSDVPTTSATNVDITGLTISVSANKKYRITGTLLVGCNNTGGVRIAINAPAGAALNVAGFIGTFNSGTVRTSTVNSPAALTFAFNTFSGTNGTINFTGYLTIGGTPGNVQMQFASTTAGQTSTVFVGSAIDLTEVV